MTTIDQISQEYPDLLVMDGFDDCIIGVCQKYGQEPFVVYSYKKIIEKFYKGGMTYDEAVEFHEFNQACAYVGEHTPGFLI